MRRTCTSSIPHVYKLQGNEILTTQSPYLFTLPAIDLKHETDPNHILFTFITLSNNHMQLTKHTTIGFLNLYMDYHVR